MSASVWHKRFHDDALNGYMGLTLEERGAYTTFLDLLYQRGEALVDNERLLAGWMQVSLRKYRAMRDRLMELGKIILLADGRLTNPRFEKERENALETSRKQAELGAKGGRNSGEARKKANDFKASVEGSASKNRSQSEARSQIEEKLPSEAKRKSGSRIPADWQPDELFARREGLGQEAAHREAQKFRDYWQSQAGARGVKTDWPATWRNWVRKAVEDANRFKPRLASLDPVERQAHQFF